MNIVSNNSDEFDDNPVKSRKSQKRRKAVSSNNIAPSDEEVALALTSLLQNTIGKYSEVAEKQVKEQRTDFDNLQPIISEFLDDYMLIGHTIDGQRVVLRYTATPADLDKLTELCKKVFVRMMIQEQNGD